MVSGFVGLLLASTVAAVTGWYSRRAALTSALALVSVGSGGMVLTSTNFDLCHTKLFIAGVAVTVLALLGTRRSDVTRWWHRHDRDRVALIGTCGVAAGGMIVTLYQLEAAVGQRFVDVLAHGTGVVAAPF